MTELSDLMAPLALLVSGISIWISCRAAKKHEYYQLLDHRMKIYEAISDFQEENYGYNGHGKDIWEDFEEGPDYLHDKMFYRSEEKLIFDNLRKARQYFPDRKKEIMRIETLLEEYRTLHIQRAYGSFEGGEELFDEGHTPAERDNLINKLRAKESKRIQTINNSLGFDQLLEDLEKDLF